MVWQISKSELEKMRREGVKFTLVDVLSKESYAKGHIPGAISIPFADLEKEAGRLLKKDDTIVVYCASFECMGSTRAAEKLKRLGYRNVFDFKGGLKEYQEDGLALEGGFHEAASGASCCSRDQASSTGLL